MTADDVTGVEATMTKNEYEDVQHEVGQVDGPSRRRVLAGVGVATVVAWAAPAVLSVQAAGAVGSELPGGGGQACSAAVLSGGTDPAETIGVDDDLDVYVNGALVFSDNDEYAQQLPPIPLGPLSAGDTIRVVASNSTYFGGPVQLTPGLYLHCSGTGQVQVLDPAGVPSQAGYGYGEVFYDKTFTVTF